MIAGPAAHQIKYYVLAVSEWVFTRAGSLADLDIAHAKRKKPLAELPRSCGMVSGVQLIR